MLNGNAGIERLYVTIDHLQSTGLNTTDFSAWLESRSTVIWDSLAQLNESPRTHEFISTYAHSLADSLCTLISAGDAVLALEAAPDYLEELASQAKRFASMATDTSPVLQEDASTLPGVAVNNNYSMAA